MATRQFDPSLTSANWITPSLGAVDMLQDYVEGTNIAINRNNANNWNTRQSGRLAVRIRNTNQGGTIDFTIPKESQLNAILSQVEELDRTVENQVGPLTIQEEGGPTVVAKNAFLLGRPQYNHSTDGVDVTWQIYSEEIIETQSGASLIS